MENKNQHWVPSSYLKAWIDPTLPKGSKGKVWVYTKSGDSHKAESPKKIFTEEELYTGSSETKERDLSVEKLLCTLESNFIGIRSKLTAQKDLPQKDFENLLFYIAAMLNRGKEQNELFKSQWENLSANIARIEKQINALNPNLVSAPTNTPPTANAVSKLAKTPLYHMLRGLTQTTADVLHSMNFDILSTKISPGFITSDNPCVLHDPDLYSRPPLFQTRGLVYPRVEITFPITPQLLILFHKYDEMGGNRQIQITDNAVDELNRRTRFYCNHHFVVNKEIAKEFWFKNHAE